MLLASPGKYLTFLLDQEEYGLRIQQVKQIVGMMEITRVPDMPAHIKGIVNLRGKIIPIADLRLKFAMAEKAYTDRTCIIVLEKANESHSLFGVLVDAVSDVAQIAEGQIDPPPPIRGSGQSSPVIGVGKIKGKVLLLLDADQLLDTAGLVGTN